MGIAQPKTQIQFKVWFIRGISSSGSELVGEKPKSPKLLNSIPFWMSHGNDISTLVLTSRCHKRANSEWSRRIFKNMSVMLEIVIA
jgi:hypothetical protein